MRSKVAAIGELLIWNLYRLASVAQRIMRRSITGLLIASLSFAAQTMCASAGETPFADPNAVLLYAKISEAPPAIELRWNSTQSSTSQTLMKRLPGEQWRLIATPGPSQCGYTDLNIVPGLVYEYRLDRGAREMKPTNGAYIRSGVDVAVEHYRGRVILVAEEAIAGELVPEIDRFTKDLEGDGWVVSGIIVSRERSIDQVKELISDHYDSTEPQSTALILLGQVPVPYSGIYAPDGHEAHHGAWPADAWYGDLDANSPWSDFLGDTTIASNQANWNVPFDGKFDQITLPAPIQLQIGRIDLSRMRLASEDDEVESLRRYLERDHQFRHRQGAYSLLPRRGLIDDNVGVLNGESFATSAWEHFSAFFGSENVIAGDWFDTLANETFLCAMGNGLGTFTTCSGVGSTADFARRPSRAVFTLLSGSYFGDWNTPNNFLRAPLAGDASLGLASIWSGRPNWVLHPMALGATIGEAVQLTQNNTGREPDFPDGSAHHQTIHIALMGDPTLRLHYPRPPANPIASKSSDGHSIVIAWESLGNTGLIGNHVYRRVSGDGPFQLLNPDPVQGSSFVDRNIKPGTSYDYMVRTLIRESTGSGLYLNLSQGAFSNRVHLPAFNPGGPEINILVDGVPVSNARPPGAQTSTILQDGSTRQITVVNAGNSALILTDPFVEIGGQHSDRFKLLGAPIPVLAAGGSRTVMVAYQADGRDEDEATVIIRSNDHDESEYSVNFRGLGKSPAKSYVGWLLAYPQLSGMLADPDSDSDLDGVRNIEEYAFGGIPVLRDAEQILPDIEQIETNPDGNSRFRIRYRQVRDFNGVESAGIIGKDYTIRDVRYVLETTDDGESWTPNHVIDVQIESMTKTSAGIIEIVSFVQTDTSTLTPEKIRLRAEPKPLPRSFESWAANFADDRVAEPSGDPDRDGISNLFEYAFGGAPLKTDSSDITSPKVRLLRNPEDGSETIEISVRQLAEIPGTVSEGEPGVDYRIGDLRYRVEISTDFVNWLGGPLTMKTLNSAIANDDRTLTAVVSPWAPASFFRNGLYVRVKVSLGNDTPVTPEL
jgi:hypothetical protein